MGREGIFNARGIPSDEGAKGRPLDGVREGYTEDIDMLDDNVVGGRDILTIHADFVVCGEIWKEMHGSALGFVSIVPNE